MTDPELKAEAERLRTELEAYRQRELADLRAVIAQLQVQVKEAWAAAENYRQQALHNAQAGRDIDANAQRIVNRLQAELEAARRMKITRARSVIGGKRR